MKTHNGAFCKSIIGYIHSHVTNFCLTIAMIRKILFDDHNNIMGMDANIVRME